MAAALAAMVLHGLARTWTIERVGFTAEDPARLSHGRCIFAFWHARLLPFVFTHRHLAAGVLISRHRDGELIARVLHRMGFVTARGSSTRGGGQGLLEMMQFAEEGRPLGVTPDGPRGPARRVKPGTVFLASRTGMPILPAASAANRTRVLRSWDGFRVPQPFSRVVVAIGEPIEVPAGLEGADVDAWCARVGDAIDALTRDVDRRAGEPA